MTSNTSPADSPILRFASDTTSEGLHKNTGSSGDTPTEIDMPLPSDFKRLSQVQSPNTETQTRAFLDSITFPPKLFASPIPAFETVEGIYQVYLSIPSNCTSLLVTQIITGEFYIHLVGEQGEVFANAHFSVPEKFDTRYWNEEYEDDIGVAEYVSRMEGLSGTEFEWDGAGRVRFGFYLNAPYLTEAYEERAVAALVAFTAKNEGGQEPAAGEEMAEEDLEEGNFMIDASLTLVSVSDTASIPSESSTARSVTSSEYYADDDEYIPYQDQNWDTNLEDVNEVEEPDKDDSANDSDSSTATIRPIGASRTSQASTLAPMKERRKVQFKEENEMDLYDRYKPIVQEPWYTRKAQGYRNWRSIADKEERERQRKQKKEVEKTAPLGISVIKEIFTGTRGR